MPGSFLPVTFDPFNPSNEADCMDRRVRTMSRGYVKVTDVIPAQPPQISRWYGLS